MRNAKWMIVLGLILIVGCAKPQDMETKIEAISVTTAKPAISEIILTTTLQGTILPIREAKISAKVGGKILRIFAAENDFVQQGAVVAKLDPTDAQIRLLQAEAGLNTAKAGLKQAKTNFELAKIEFERAQKLKETDSIAQAAFDKASTGYKMASSQVELANAQVNQAETAIISAKQGLGDTNITAPISGIITSKYLNEGEMTSQSPILAIMDISTIKLEVATSSNLITKIKRDQSVQVWLGAYPDKRWTGIIYCLSPTINPQSRTFETTIYLKNPQGLLKPGMFARCRLEVEKHSNVLCLPQGAVFNRGLDNYLYVIEANKAKLKQVKLGIQDLEKVEIIEGLNMADEVVIRGVENLQDGSLVKVTKK
ncbi:MAG: efflux RND transporter periplasmic adaptor subunit [bacterium]